MLYAMHKSTSGVSYRIILLLFLFLHCGDAFVCDGRSAGRNANELLQIHLVPHTHDDVGWLKTVDQYYYGANNSIQMAGVQYILDALIPALEANPLRHFIYVEMAFFKRWWEEQEPAMQDRVKALVDRGQLEFASGGWCMNDEGTTHYNAIIDQMTHGLQFINQHFGSKARPRVAWHIDTFGHSAEQASLFAQMSFEGFFFARIDYADRKKRIIEQEMELLWRGSKSLGRLSEIFTGVLYRHYSPPNSFCFDIRCDDPPIQDDQRLFDDNVKERVELFVNESCEQALHYKSGHIMLTMGDDFNYQNANMWFKNLDKLIKYVNKDGRVNAFYSTPSKYLNAIRGIEVKLKTDDFFPYANCPHCYWSGYFTSRPALKGYVRRNNNLLQICKQLEVLSSQQDSIYSSETLRDAMGVAQHHDAVTGTEKQHVAYDYAKRLAMGAENCKMLINSAFNKMVAHAEYTFCDYLNISVCPGSETARSFVVTAYNPLARNVSSYARVPLSSNQVKVYGVDGKPVRFAIQPVTSETKHVRGTLGNAPYELVFLAENLPPLGLAVYQVRTSSNETKSTFNPGKRPYKRKTFRSKNTENEYVIENEHLRLTFSAQHGRLVQFDNVDSRIRVSVDQQFFWYNSSVGNNISGQGSNAYIFRPNSSTPFNISHENRAKIRILKNNLVQEVQQVFNPWVSQIVRLYAHKPYAEFEYTVGPIEMHRELGKEVISRFDTSLKTDGVFYTDANGREMQRRKRNYRPTWTYEDTEPVAGNYYPVNSRAYIVDNTGIQLTVMTDRSVGGSSIRDGSLEFMVHRRLLYNDGTVGGEPLNELGRDGRGLIVRGRFLVLLEHVKTSAKLHRSIGEEDFLRPLLAFSDGTVTGSNNQVEKYFQVGHTYLGHLKHEDNFGSRYQALTRPLPVNVHLLTLEKFYDVVLLRLEHQFAINEDEVLSKPITVQLKGLFRDFTILAVTELNLSGNLVKNDVIINDIYDVTLNAMEIRTFKLDIEWKR